jgi:hypothetical protein
MVVQRWGGGGIFWDYGHEQLISNGGRFKAAFAERDKKQTRVDLRGISANWFKNHFYVLVAYILHLTDSCPFS